MRIFKDNAARPWTVAINVDAIKRIRAETGVDIIKIGDGEAKLINQLADDPILLVDVLYAACRPEAENQGITPEQFGQAMAGDAIESATAALMAEIVDFFPSRRRAVLKAALAKVDEGWAAATARMLKDLAKLDMSARINKAMDAAETQTDPAESGSSSTSSPASPESIPDPSPSAK